MPEQLFEQLGLGSASTLAEVPGVDTQTGDAPPGEGFRIRRRLQLCATAEKLVLSQNVVAAVRVVVDDGWRNTCCRSGSGEIGRHRFPAIEVQQEHFQVVPLVLFTRDQLSTDRTDSV